VAEDRFDRGIILDPLDRVTFLIFKNIIFHVDCYFEFMRRNLLK